MRASSDHFGLEVSDTGCGIAQEDLPRIFQRFARVPVARARAVEGSGIGLSLVQELTKLHGGTVEVGSQLSAGTTIVVHIPTGFAHLPQERIGSERTLPPLHPGTQPFLDEALGWLENDGVAAASDDGYPEASIDTPSEGVSQVRERILVVEDNAQMRHYLSWLLRHRWRIESAPDGVAAIEHIRLHAPDAVLADVMMPRMNGIEMVRALRAHAATAELPVLLLSARAGEEASVEGLQAGANDYLVKPFSRRELIARVETLLAQGRQHAAERRARTQAEHNVRAREEFFAALAHELRSPVSSLFSWVEHLQSEKLTRAKLVSALEVLELTGRALRRLSDDLYDVARGASERMRINPRPFASLSPLVASVVEAFGPAASKKHIALQQTLHKESGPVNVDVERLQQILANLLSNAIRFTPSGGRIDVSCARRADTVELCVSDSGRGIRSDDLPHVFGRYWQGERAPDDDSGLGLGLSISRRLVELHGGEILALSEGEGTGAAFIVRVPVSEARPEDHHIPQKAEATSRVLDAALAAEVLAERQLARDKTAAA
jgi:signal transduction histidine kinase